LSTTLAESELFGHVRGAFTGADQSRSGLLVQADRGTLFLDEVADIPLPIQVKLLRVLDHGEVTPVGSNEAVKTDFRVVSATHRDLMQQVGDGRFRHDLYFRLCAFRIDLPPLRERGGDIGDLARHFAAGPTAGAAAGVTDQTLDELKRRPWYGNVRELRNAIEHATILARGGAIMPEHLPPPAAPFAPHENDTVRHLPERIVELVAHWAELRLSESDESRNLHEQLLALVEPPVLRAALGKHRGQCAGAARHLGLHRTTLRKKLDQYGIES
jgi:two-component system nitrogen regulation response regulator GlnG